MVKKYKGKRGTGKSAPRRRRKIVVIVLLILVLFSLAGAGVYYYFFSGRILAGWTGLNMPGKIIAPKRLTTCPLDGTAHVNDNLINRRPLIIKVENHPDARPQSGLDKADIVIEAMAEGGITRFAAIYLCREVDEIGPVRSGRLQDLTFLDEYDALFAHVGGSDAWMREKSGIADLDEFAYSDAYWRSDERDAPHNCYTTTERIHKTAAEEGLEKTVSLETWSFKSGHPGKGNVGSVTIPYGAGCEASYKYDKKSNTYLRSVDGEPLLDKPTGNQIAPKNVIIMYISYESDDSGEDYGLGGRDIMQLVGEGKAVIMRDGEAITGRWTKASTSSRTYFLDGEGRPVEFNRGQTWIEIIPESWEITLG